MRVFMCSLRSSASTTLARLLFFQVIAPAALFLAAKVEEQPRKLEHVIKVAHACLYPQDPPLDTKSDVSGFWALYVELVVRYIHTHTQK